MKDEKEVSRREFMKTAIYAVGGLIGAALGIPAVAYVIGPALKKDDSEWLRLGSLSDITIGTPTLFKPRVTRQTGWMQEEDQLGVFVHTEDGREYTALSNICTHLGCRVRWIGEKQQYFSPCHNGVFDTHGYVVSGPPPRPLDAFETKIEEGQLYIKLPAFKRAA